MTANRQKGDGENPYKWKERMKMISKDNYERLISIEKVCPEPRCSACILAAAWIERIDGKRKYESLHGIPEEKRNEGYPVGILKDPK